ncbi:MAG: hypothetical protein FWH10_04115 [Oscillospiraceae bacterium]|nr:hypothetical protein [Oscillospiraceae bacterium]
MVQTYQGYFKNGRFMTLEAVEIPEEAEVYIMVTGRKAKHPEEEEDISKRTEIFESLKGCLTGYDVDLKTIRDERLNRRLRK